MGPRFKTLTVGLVLATAAVAGCSSTTGSSGAVQNDATAPASPVASPTDSPSASESPQSAALLGTTKDTSTDVCDADLAYSCGDIGASGVGIVFYANSTSFACGANMASTCNYLEVAPNLWNPDSQIACKAATGGTSCGGSVQTTSDFSSSGLGFPWCTGSGGTASIDQGRQNDDIGAGFANTTAMLSVCNPGDAGNVARSYTGGGLTDWSLASLLELSELYFYNNRAAIGGFNSGLYWSSMEFNSTKAHDWPFNPNGGTYYDKSTSYGVRPVRAF